jgi:dipeptidyl aminopeptidase/acylaminoacyl peptidase
MKSRFGFFGLALLSSLLLFPIALGAQGLPPLLDREVFFGDPEIASAQLSPDGQYVSFRRPHQGVMNLWVKGIDEPFEAARPVTAATDRPIPGYLWSRDSRYLLYVQDRAGDENYHVWAVDPSGAVDGAIPEPRNLTPVEGARALIYSVPRSRPAVIMVGLNDRDASFHDVYQVDLSSGERTLLIENTEEVAGFFFDSSGNVRLGIRQTPGGGTEMLTVADGRVAEQVYTCTFEESCGPVRAHPDGRRVYLLTNRGADVDLARLVLFDPETGEEVVVEQDPEGQVDLAGAVFSDVSEELIATFYFGDRLRIYAQSQEFARDLERLRQGLPGGDVLPGSTTADERLMLVSVTRDVDPGSTYLYDRDSGEISFLYRSRPEFPVEHMAGMEPIRYTARDGLEIPGYLTLPQGVEPRNLPLVVHPHGGPWARDTWGYDSFAQFLANRGYAVLQPNFRGSTGFGKAFLNAGNREWGTGYMQHDITDGVQHLISEGIADPDRIAIHGGSYGGYATLAGVTFTPDLYAAAIPYVAPSSLITLIESFPAYWRPFLEGTWYRRVGDPQDPEDRADLIARSPLTHVDSIRTPLLVVHGANDPRVTQRESDQLVVALRDRGIAVEYIVAPDEGHGFAGRNNRMALAVAMERFLAEHVGGRHQPDVPDVLAERLEVLTVDPATVEVADVVASDPSALPPAEFDGSRLAPVTLSYVTTLEAMGQELRIEQEITASAAEENGAAVWRVASVGTMMGQPMEDVILVTRDDLRPLRRSIQQGPQQIEVTYGADRVTAVAGPMGELGADYEGVIAVDGPVFDVGLGTLPLAPGYSARIQLFELAQASIRPYAVTVTGTEVVTVPAGTFETFVVEIRPADGSAPRRVYVSAEDPRVVVRQIAPLPAQMGGGTATSELVEVMPDA